MSSPFKRGKKKSSPRAEAETVEVDDAIKPEPEAEQQALISPQEEPTPQPEPEPKLETPKISPRVSPRVNITEPSSTAKKPVPILPLDDEVLRLQTNDEDEIDHITPKQEESHLQEINQENPADSNKTASVKSAKQDFQGAADRMKRLRQFHSSCCFGWLFYPVQYMRLGYDIEEFNRYKSFEDANKGLDLHRDTAGLCVSINIKEIATVKEHIIGLIRPFIRVHTLYLDSGLYVRSADKPPAKPTYTKAQLSQNGGSKAIWNEDLIIEANYADIASENTIILFEILDIKASVYLEKKQQEARNYFKKVAWGYLLPIGSYGQLNVPYSTKASAKTPRHETEGGQDTARGAPGTARLSARGKSSAYKFPTKDLRIQLYRYRFYDGLIGGIQRGILSWPALNPRYLAPPDDPAYPNEVPSVFLQYKLLRKIPVEGAYLSIGIGPKVLRVKTPRGLWGGTGDEGDGDNDSERSSPRSKFGDGDGDTGEGSGGLYERIFRKKKKRMKSREESNHLRATALRRGRRAEDACLVPDKFLRRVEVGFDGAMVVSFSHSGHLLAIASRFDTQSAPLYGQDYIYSLILYSTDTDEEVWSDYISHHAVIYSLTWSKNDRYLLSCGGDGSAKVYDLIYFCPLLDLMQEEAEHNQNNDSNPPSPILYSKQHLLQTSPPKVLQVLSLGAANYCYAGVFQDFSPSLQTIMSTYHSLSMLGTGHLYGVTPLSDSFMQIVNAPIPRIILGGEDGRLRVYEDHKLLGYLSVQGNNKPVEDAAGAEKSEDFSPHDAPINAMVLEERSKYLLTGDANGDIYAWRPDKKGWYQLLRKFKHPPPPHFNPLVHSNHENFDQGSILSLLAHPVKSKSLLCVHTRQPASIKVISMATYKPVSYCEGYTGVMQSYLVREDEQLYSAGIYFKASFSADGRYIICCNTTSGVSSISNGKGNKQGHEIGGYRLLVWDTYTGHLIHSPLSALVFPYPIRSIAWHPSQHLLAISMVGEGAAVVLYSAEADSSLRQAAETSRAASASTIPNATLDSTLNLNNTANSLNSTLNPLSSSVEAKNKDEFTYSLLDNSAFIRGMNTMPNNGNGSGNLDGTGQVLQGTVTFENTLKNSMVNTNPGQEKADRIDRAKEMLERIRTSKNK